MELRMSMKERDRIKALEMVRSGMIGQEQAGEMLGVSARHVRRLMRRYESEGDAGLVHKGRGRSSNRRIARETRERVLEKLRGEYLGFGPTLAAEKLAERDGITVSRETVRGWMIGAGLAGPGREKRPHRRRRPRRPCFGELVQMDTSEHDWLEGRGERLSLVTMIDDATGRKLARFFPSDSGAANREMIRLWIEAHGRPVALYTDHAAHFRRVAAAGENAGPTQIERALGELNIRLIVAHSPQAKGRVERSHGTDQDRLVKELRLEGARTREKANEFLERRYLPKINARFAVRPQDQADAHRGAEGLDLAAILSHQETRSVARDWTIQFEGKPWQLEGEAVRGMEPLARVTVEWRLDGTTRVRWGDRYLGYRLAPPSRRDRPGFDEDEEGREILARCQGGGGSSGLRPSSPPPP